MSEPVTSTGVYNEATQFQCLSMELSGVEPFSPLEIHPTSTSTPVSTSTPTNPHVCGSCGKTFNRKDNKDRHTASFLGKTSVKCKRCPKQFSSKWAAELHSSTAHRPSVQCEICFKSFSSINTLKKHKQDHDGNFRKMDDNAMFDVETMKRHLTSRYVGQFLVYKTLTSSTMDDARKIANAGGPEGAAVLAECQTGGRGQDGHVWHSPDRGNIYVTFILRKPKTLKNRVGIQDLEFVGSCSVLKAVQELGVHGARLKWKNDLWCRGHKLAGALVETPTSSQGGDGDMAVFLLGIGVNVNSDVRRHPRLRHTATSVSSELGCTAVSRERLFSRICHHLETCLEMDRSTLFQQMKEFQLFRIGSEVNVHSFKDHTKLYSGFIAEVRDDWTCLVRDGFGREHHLGDGVSLRPNPADTVLVFGEPPSPLADSLQSLVDTSSYTVNAIAVQDLERFASQIRINGFGREHHLGDGVSLRPNPADTVLVFGEPPSPLADSLQSLVDTSSYTVNAIAVQDLVKGDWRSSCLVVFCGLVPEDVQLHASLLKYVDEGGKVLAIGRAVQQINHLIKDLQVCASTKSETRKDLIKISFKDDLSGSEYWFYNYQSNTVYQISQTFQPIRVLATNEQGETIAEYCRIGQGGVIVVGFDLDITYADLKDTQGINANTISSLSQTVFQRDRFFLQILEMLLTREVCGTT